MSVDLPEATLLKKSDSFYEANITKISEPKHHREKKKYSPISPRIINVKTVSKPLIR